MSSGPTEAFDPGCLRHPTNVTAYEYWTRLRGDRPMPALVDINAADIVGILSNVFLLDVRPPPIDFRYRLIGTSMSKYMKHDHTGNWMSVIPHQKPPSQIWDACVFVAEHRIPFSSNTPYVGKYSEFKSTEDLIMPLSADGKSVDALFVTADFL